MAPEDAEFLSNNATSIAPPTQAAPPGYETAPPEIAHQLDKDMEAGYADQDKYGNSPIRTFLERTLSSATLGLSDQIQKHFGGEEAVKGMRERELRNPISSTAGEVTGIVGPAIVTEGGSLSKYLPVTAAETAGKVTARAVENVLAKTGAKTLAKDVIRKSISAAAGSSVTGAGFGLGQLVKEDALGTADFNAENLIAEMGHGALVGGALGAGFGAAESVVPVLTKNKAVDFVVEKVKTWTDPNEAAMNMTLGATKAAKEKMRSPEAFNNAANFLKEHAGLRPLITDGELLTNAEASMKKIGGDIRGTIQKIDDAVGGHGGVLPTRMELAQKLKDSAKQLEPATFGTAADEGKSLIRRHNESIDKAFGLDKITKLESDFNKYEELIQNKVEKLENKFTEAGEVGRTKISAQIAKENEDYLAQRSMFQNKHVELSAELNKPVSAEELLEHKIEAQKLTNYAIDPKGKLTQKIQRGTVDIIRKEINGIAEKASTLGLPDAAFMLKKQNLDYHTGSVLVSGLRKKAYASDSVAKSLSSMLNSKDIALGVLGTMTGAQAPIAALIAAKKFAETDFAHRLVILNGIEKANQAAIRQIGKAADAFLSTGKKAVRAAQPASTKILLKTGFLGSDKQGAPKNKKEAFERITNTLASFSSDPEKLINHAVMSTQRIAQAAPETAMAIQAKMGTAITFLNSKIPKDPNPGSGPFKREWEPSNQELAKFERYLAVVERPMSVMDDLEAGTLTGESIEALKAVYPELYSKIYQTMIEKVADTPKMSYSKKAQLSLLFDTPLDSSMQPEAIKAFQQQFVTEANQTSPSDSTSAAAQRAMSSSDRSGRLQTPVGDVEEGLG